MRILNQVRRYGAASAVLAILGAQVVALADEAPAGEMWQMTMSMEMAGMSMPPRTMQMCVPKGKAQEALSKPQGPGVGDNCSIQDASHDGTHYSAKFMCTGKQPVQGTVDTVVEGDHAKTTMTMQVNGQTMTMKNESQKVGTPCTPKTVPGAK
ncbi:MAG TPA: DUF3617 family protein [Steroidobacteraceae bacterium]|nr:DUF3617 family protein [Steroidobacteraceae bacterium]